MLILWESCRILLLPLPCKTLIHTHFWVAFGTLTSELGQNDLVFGVQSGLIIGLCMQDYKSLCAAVMLCATLVNIQIDR